MRLPCKHPPRTMTKEIIAQASAQERIMIMRAQTHTHTHTHKFFLYENARGFNVYEWSTLGAEIFVLKGFHFFFQKKNQHVDADEFQNSNTDGYFLAQ